MSTPPSDAPSPPAPSRASRLASLRQTLAAGRTSLSPLTLGSGGSGGSALGTTRRGGLGVGVASGGECLSSLPRLWLSPAFSGGVLGGVEHRMVFDFAPQPFHRSSSGQSRDHTGRAFTRNGEVYTNDDAFDDESLPDLILPVGYNDSRGTPPRPSM